MYCIKMKTVLVYLLIATFLFCAAQYAAKEPAVLTSAEEAKVELPILMYHALTENPKDVSTFVISKEMFEQDLQYLQKAGYETVSLEQILDFVRNGTPLPDKPVLLTFDDGYYNNYCYAYPLLQQYHAKAVISIIGKYTDIYTESHEENPAYSHITWDQAREMMASGLVEIGNHTYDLHTNDEGRDGCKKCAGESLSAYRACLMEDVGKLQKAAKENLGYTPVVFAYPFGSVSEASYDILDEMGFFITLSCEEKSNTLTQGDFTCLKMMNRYLRSDKNSAEKILSTK